MSVTNEDRRAVAKLLRDGSTVLLHADCYSCGAVSEIVYGRTHAACGDCPSCEETISMMIAELIEPRTCRLVPFETPGHLPNGVRCSNCGETFMFGLGDWDFCPKCGAEVTEVPR